MTSTVWTLAAMILGLLFDSAPAAAQTSPPARWRGAVDLTIGGADASDSASFGRVSGLAVDALGRIYAGDAQDNQIRVFSPAGKLLAKLGRMGSGPLEFKRLATITIGPDRLLWARDEGNARMLAIDVSATPAREIRTIPLHQFTGGSRIAITFEPDGSMVDETIWYDKEIDVFRPLRARHSPSGTISRIDTLPVPEGAFAGMYKVSRVQKDASGKQIGMSQGYTFQPFGPYWLRAYGPGGLRAEAVTSRYEVKVVDGAGRVLRTLKRDAAPVPLSTRERRTADSTLNKAKERDKDNLPFGVPAAKSPIVSLMWTSDGQIWVERAVADGAVREADVFDQSGRWVAIAEWPDDIRLGAGFPVIVGRTVTAVATDKDDAARIVRLKFR